MGDLSEFFSLSEFRCPCLECETIVNPKLIHGLEQIRKALNVPILITSGYRCEAYNRKIGGVKDSAHLTGEGADIAITGSKIRYLMLERAVIWFQRIGLYDKHIHLDVSQTLPRPRLWIGLSK